MERLKFDIQASILTLTMITANQLNRLTGSSTAYIDQFDMLGSHMERLIYTLELIKLGSWTYGTSDSHQIKYLSVCTYTKCDY